VLPPKTASMSQWTERLATYARSSEAKKELNYWQSKVSSLPTTSLAAKCAPRNTFGSVQTARRGLSEEDTTRFLQDAIKPYRTSAAELLLAAVAKTLSSETDNSPVILDMEGHGREELFDDVDVSRTVGWFTSLFPLVVEAPQEQDCQSWIIAAKEQSRAVPNRGVGYGILKWLTEEKVRSQLPIVQTETVFNYLGSFDQLMPEDSLLGEATQSAGSLYDPQNVRPHKWEINAYVRQGRLCIEWNYSSSIDAEPEMERRADLLINTLNEMIEHCTNQDEGRATPSDFPMADVDQQELDRVAAMLSQLDD